MRLTIELSGLCFFWNRGARTELTGLLLDPSQLFEYGGMDRHEPFLVVPAVHAKCDPERFLYAPDGEQYAIWSLRTSELVVGFGGAPASLEFIDYLRTHRPMAQRPTMADQADLTWVPQSSRVFGDFPPENSLFLPRFPGGAVAARVHITGGQVSAARTSRWENDVYEFRFIGEQAGHYSQALCDVVRVALDAAESRGTYLEIQNAMGSKRPVEVDASESKSFGVSVSCLPTVLPTAAENGQMPPGDHINYYRLALSGNPPEVEVLPVPTPRVGQPTEPGFRSINPVRCAPHFYP